MGGAISQTKMICLKRTNCRLWLGPAWGIMEALKIAHAVVKFREPAQVASSRLHRPELSGKVSRGTTPVKLNNRGRHIEVYFKRAQCSAMCDI